MLMPPSIHGGSLIQVFVSFQKPWIYFESFCELLAMFMIFSDILGFLTNFLLDFLHGVRVRNDRNLCKKSIKTLEKITWQKISEIPTCQSFRRSMEIPKWMTLVFIKPKIHKNDKRQNHISFAVFFFVTPGLKVHKKWEKIQLDWKVSK